MSTFPPDAQPTVHDQIRDLDARLTAHEQHFEEHIEHNSGILTSLSLQITGLTTCIRRMQLGLEQVHSAYNHHHHQYERYITNLQNEIAQAQQQLLEISKTRDLLNNISKN